MANPEHVAKLKEGVEAWNAWRAANSNEWPDLSDCNCFASADLRGANLSDVHLRRADLRETNLSGANLNDADLYETNLHCADLNDANLSQADLTRSDLSKASLQRVDASRAFFRLADLSGADFTDADLRLSHLHWSLLSKTDFLNTDLRGAQIPTAVNLDDTLCVSQLTGSINLQQDQIDTMTGDRFTGLPPHLTRPNHWNYEGIQMVAEPIPSTRNGKSHMIDPSADDVVFGTFLAQIKSAVAPQMNSSEDLKHASELIYDAVSVFDRQHSGSHAREMVEIHNRIGHLLEDLSKSSNQN